MTDNFDGTERSFLFASRSQQLKAAGSRLAYPFISFSQNLKKKKGTEDLKKDADEPVDQQPSYDEKSIKVLGASKP